MLSFFFKWPINKSVFFMYDVEIHTTKIIFREKLFFLKKMDGDDIYCIPLDIYLTLQ